MNTFRDVIDKWPSLRDFAADIGVQYVTAQVMRWRGSINADHWDAVVQAAKQRGFDGITIELLAKLKRDAKARPSRRAAYQPAA